MMTMMVVLYASSSRMKFQHAFTCYLIDAFSNVFLYERLESFHTDTFLFSHTHISFATLSINLKS